MKDKVKPFALLLLAVLTLSACSFRGFQPPPAEVDLWQKPGKAQPDIEAAMLGCGYRNAAGVDASATLEQKAESFECMKRAGFVRNNGFDLCHTLRERHLKACQPAPADL